jgi:hypothetical protein
MTIWRLEYFESGSVLPYMSGTYFSAEERDSAVTHYLRLGGDDLLKVTTARPLKIILSIFKRLGLSMIGGLGGPRFTSRRVSPEIAQIKTR